jgi:hypothetical protein
MSARVFPMSLDRANRVLTVVLAGLLAGVVAVQVALCTGPVAWVPWLTTALLLLFLGPAFALAPHAVEVDGDEVRVCRRLWRPLRIPRRAIVRVDAGPAITQANAVRVCGTGPFFGSFGLLYVIGFGRVRGYVTRGGSSVVLHRAGGVLPVLLTPDDPAGFAACLGAAGASHS